MENTPDMGETEIELLARLVKAGLDRMDKGFEEMHAGFVKTDERFATVDERFTDVTKRIDNLSYKVDQLDAKLGAHRQETKDGFASFQAIIGSLSHTVVDHEERIKELEGE
jgi:uncharacterized coiled-coil DUF342 family protein